MSNIKKLMMSAAGGAGPDVDEVFSTYLYEGTGAEQTITNGIDLDGEGGLVWFKARTDANTGNHYAWDTERGADSRLSPNRDDAEATGVSSNFVSFNSNGVTLGFNFIINQSSQDYASWTFRKAPKFFDVVTYTGNGTSGRTISHNLGATPGVILIKCTSSAENWRMWHTDFATNESIMFNSTGVKTSTVNFLNNTSPTSTTITLGNHKDCNASGDSYVAYLFAHNDGDGGFGPDGDQDIIKCGSYTGNGSSNGPEINLGFEPQWLMVKSSTFNGGPWYMVDNMRGFGHGINNAYMYANGYNTEFNDYELFRNTGQGFQPRENFSVINGSGQSYIYMAIRRGSLLPPESATDVFGIKDRYSEGSLPSWQPGYVTDMALRKRTSGSDTYVYDRLRQGKELAANATSTDATTGNTNFDYMNGFGDVTSTSSGDYAWMWKRAPGYFDVVAYAGNSVSGRSLNHNLGVVPEMMWVKNRDSPVDWWIYHKDLGNTKYMFLNLNGAAVTDSTAWNNTTPTETVFTLGNSGRVNYSNDDYIAYLFASLPGISKVGSYTGNGSSQTINCGFSAGARFVLIKRTDFYNDQGWFMYDTVRGINAGDDPRMFLNNNNAQVSDTNSINAHASGFSVNNDGNFTNTSGANFIFYAVA